ncbi:DUF692 domain-containing protein [Luteimonas salinilitoris]|uniref:UPF0276 protein AB6713_05045 n=1 Tax=Luteimonas salinilitoris TaxID=3237697 RepID=A0ABV4HMM8_9GAMM
MAALLAPASAGLGLRRGLLPALQAASRDDFDFLECAPENWIGVGGRLGAAFEALAARHPLTCHGLSLSLGGVEPLDETFLRRLREFLDRHRVTLYSEHLSCCADDGQLYDLMPVPFTEASVKNAAARIRRVQEALGRRIAVENVSYYAAPYQAMAEADFILAVLEEADCDLLLDVNNVHVNAINHGYDAADFLARMPSARIASYHVAGHYDEAEDLKVDTHGAAVIPEVWELLRQAYRLHGLRPTLLERDFNFPPFAELLAEVRRIRDLQHDAAPRQSALSERSEKWAVATGAANE